MNVAELVVESAKRHAGNIAVIDGDRQVTYAELDARTNRVAHSLLREGLQKGDRVAILIGNRAEWFDLTFGLMKAGLVRVHINPRWSAAEVGALLQKVEPAALIISEQYAGLLQELDVSAIKLLVTSDAEYDAMIAAGSPEHICRDMDPDDLLALWFSSGTTGEPKGVMQSHGIWSVCIPTMGESLGLKSDDVLLHVGPMGHASGSFGQPVLAAGGTNVVLRGFDPVELVESIQKYGVTTLMLVPTMIYDLLDLIEERGIDASSLRTIVYGTAPMEPERLGRCIEVLGPIFLQMYGQAECGIISILRREDHLKGGSVLASAGKLIPEMQIRLVDDNCNDVPVGEVGEIVGKGPLVMQGYWRNPERTKAALDADGWLHTADMGRLGEDGYLYIVDRKDDKIVTGGYNVYPNDIEQVLIQHPAVAEAAAFGVPHPRWGEAVTAEVRLVDGANISEAEIRDWCRERLTGYKVPKSIFFRSDPLPRNPNGKLLRRLVREPYWANQARQVG